MKKVDIEQLLSSMTLAEKAGQMTQLTLGALLKGPGQYADKPYAFDQELLSEAFAKYPIGSVLNTPGEALSPKEWQKYVQKLQEMAKNTRLGIPVLYGIDSTHGAGYVYGAKLFPQQIGMAASWNPALVEEAASITAMQSSTAGINWNFSPVQDICMHPAWPRLYEGFGESPWLAARMGEACVRGYQGEDLRSSTKVAACLKHFVGYGAPASGKDRTPAHISERILRQDHLPPFAAGFKAGAATVMINSGDINGTPVHASRWLLTDILREELGFDGLVVTDWQDIQYLHTRHRVADSQREAVRLALHAGIDMSMVPEDLSFPGFVVDLVEKGEITESRIDESVRRILSLKQALGLLDEADASLRVEPASFSSKQYDNTAYQLASESITLLKNEGNTLPLKPEIRVLLTGPTSNSRASIVGGWSYTWQGDRADEAYTDQVPTLKEVFEKKLNNRCVYVPGSGFEESLDIAAAVKAAADVDHIVCCLGEDSYTEFFGNIDDLHLPKAQIELVEALAKTGKPITLVLLEGRPRLITSIADKVNAIVMAYLPGEAGAPAIVDVLFGAKNPEGKLPFTYPAGPNGPEGLHAVSSEYDMPQQGPVSYKPLFDFGHGLSYTTFTYKVMAVSKTKVVGDEEFTVKIRVANDGDRTGSEVVQLYFRDHFASVVLPMRRLIRFEKVTIEAGSYQDVTFRLSKDDLAFVNAQNEWVTEAGDFSLMSDVLEVAINYEPE
ncbi:MAG: glycoside hydrolase family 3 N-terminal domain-containing protein [Bacteroidia bacterium]